MANRGSFCSNCGTPIVPSAIFCVNCGARIAESDPSLGTETEARIQRGIFDILGETFGVYKRNFSNFIVIVAVVQIPLSLVTWLVFGTVDFPAGDDLSVELFIDFGIRVLVLAILGGMAWLLMQGALIHGISEQFFRGPVRIQEAYAFALSRFFPMLGAFIVSGLAIVLMAITLIGIPFAIAFIVYWFFVLQSTSLGRNGPTAAMSESYRLVRGHWWWVLGFLIISAVLIGIIGSVIAGLIGVIIPVVGSTIGEILVAPILIIAQTLFYLELKNRHSLAAAAEDDS